MVRQIAKQHGKRIALLPGFGWLEKLPVRLAKKAFGSLTYARTDTVSEYDFEESVKRSENG